MKNVGYYSVEKNDVLSTLASLGDNSFDGLLMDSPYGLSFMEKKWDDALPSVEVCRELLRVAKPGAMLVAFGSPKTHHRLACHIEDAGWEVRDCLMWLYGEAKPQGLDISKAIDKKLGAKREVVGTKPNQHRGVRTDHRYGFQSPDQPVEITVPTTPEAALWDGYNTTLKPAWEPVLFAMKPRKGTFASNALEWGCGGLNIRASRIEGTVTTNPLVRNAKGFGSDGLVQGSTGKGLVSEGRWPANVILDEAAAEHLDRQGPKSKSRRSARRKVGGNVGNGNTMRRFTSRQTNVGGYDDEGGPSRFFYCAKASRRERQGNQHPCVKPLRLCQYLAKLILPPAGFRKLLVPYCGTGSEMIGALLAGWDYVVGIERETDYVEIAMRRLASLDAA